MTDDKPKRQRFTLELDEMDVELLISALKLAATTRKTGRGLLKWFGREPEQTPLADARELKLLELLTKTIGN